MNIHPSGIAGKHNRRKDLPPQQPAGQAPDPTTALSPVPDGVPAVLRNSHGWVGWRYVPRPGRGKPAKLPINPLTGGPAGPTNPRTWGRFDDAVAACRTLGLSGIGFVFHPAGPFAGLDLDRVRDPDTGELHPGARAVLREVDTYAEVSPSGTGVKAFGFARIDPAGPHKLGGIEVYDRDRFFAVTGRRLPDFPAAVEPRQEQFRRLQARLRKPTRPPGPGVTRPNTGGGFAGPDHELLGRAFAARNGAAVRRRWDGDRGGCPSASEALLGLARLLAFWTGPDEARLLALVGGSPLGSAAEAERGKWESRRPGGTWGLVLVRKAIDTCPEFYAGPPTAKPTPPPDEHHCISSGSHSGVVSCPVGTALRRVEHGDVPAGVGQRVRAKTARLRNGLVRLAGVCWHLAGREAGGQFPLGVEVVARAFGVGINTSSRWLNALDEQGVIRLLKKGNSFSGRASEWEWVGFGPPPADVPRVPCAA